MRLLVIFVSATLYGGDALSDIWAKLLPMRGSEGLHPSRGATQEFTTIKHQLRDWIESRFSSLKWNGSRWIPDPTLFQEQLNDEMERAGLLCRFEDLTCANQSGLGYLERITLELG